jgi:hypothetical protein
VFAHSGGLPRRINRLCSRVLLYGALEETDDITATMVDTTAEELAQDLEGGQPAGPPAANGSAHFPRADFPRASIGHPEFARLSHDLHTELHAEPDRESTAVAELRQRLDALESRVARRDRVFQRLLEALSGHAPPQP